VRKKGLVIMLICILLLVTACSGNKETSSQSGGDTKAEKKEQLVIVDWGGEGIKNRLKAYIEPFEKEYGVDVVTESPTDYGKLKAMVESGNVEWDVVAAETEFVDRGAADGLLEKIDYDVVDKSNMEPWLAHEYGVGAEIYSVSIAYNKDMMPNGEHPETWAEFWDTEKYPGKRTMWNYPVGLLEIALLADGVKKDEIYPIDIDRAFNSLDKIKDNIIWWSAGEEAIQLLASGEVPLGNAWNGRVVVAKEDGAPIDIEYKESIVVGDSWVIPKGTKNKELAMKFLDFVTSAESIANWATLMPYLPINPKAKDLIEDKDALKEIENFESQSDSQLTVDTGWWFENFDKVNERFQQWLIK
jgi:putative spermidine/putrescine transport system substrate-binding protein